MYSLKWFALAGKAKLYLCPLRVFRWAWELNWYKQIKRRNAWNKSSVCDVGVLKTQRSGSLEDPKKWHNRNAFIPGWTKRGSCGELTHIYGEPKGRDLFCQGLCVQDSRGFDSPSLAIRIFLSFWHRKDIFHMGLFSVALRKKRGEIRAPFFYLLFFNCL